MRAVETAAVAAGLRTRWSAGMVRGGPVLHHFVAGRKAGCGIVRNL